MIYHLLFFFVLYTAQKQHIDSTSEEIDVPSVCGRMNQTMLNLLNLHHQMNQLRINHEYQLKFLQTELNKKDKIIAELRTTLNKKDKIIAELMKKIAPVKKQ